MKREFSRQCRREQNRQQPGRGQVEDLGVAKLKINVATCPCHSGWGGCESCTVGCGCARLWHPWFFPWEFRQEDVYFT